MILNLRTINCITLAVVAVADDSANGQFTEPRPSPLPGFMLIIVSGGAGAPLDPGDHCFLLHRIEGVGDTFDVLHMVLLAQLLFGLPFFKVTWCVLT